MAKSATCLLGCLASAGVLLLGWLEMLPAEIGGFAEILGVVTGVWSVVLLGRNHPAGWWIGLVMVSAYGLVFYRARLFAEVGIQAFYFVTSLQAIWIWMHGGANRSERPVGRVTPAWVLASGVALTVGVGLLSWLLIALRGAAPFWDALTTVGSVLAHVYLMRRLVESWLLWIAVDVIYVPLYASRGLYLTAALYVGFLGLAVAGYVRFRRIEREQRAQTGATA